MHDKPKSNHAFETDVANRESDEDALTSVIARDVNSLMGFSTVHGIGHQVLNSAGDYVKSVVQISAELRGRFLRPEASTTNTSSAFSGKEALGLIFYRRNIFKVAASIGIPGGLESVVTESGPLRIIGLQVELDAIDSVDESPVRIFQLPMKNDATPSQAVSATSQASKMTMPPSIEIKYGAGTSESKSVTTSWERLQFRHATVKKRGTWQYFQLRVTVLATLEDGSKKALSSSISTLITVRGRSPRSFPGSKNTAKQKDTTTGHVITSSEDNGDTRSPLDFPMDLPSSLDITSDGLLFYDFSDFQMWGNGPQSLDNRKEKYDYAEQAFLGGINDTLTPGVSSELLSEKDINHHILPNTTPLLPPIPHLDAIFRLPAAPPDNTSVFDHAPISTLSIPGDLQPRHHEPSSESDDLNTSRVPTLEAEAEDETEDERSESDSDEKSTYSYEYIPLSINDWTVPVDAVYRPHGIHAKKVLDTGQSVTKKRYFLAVK